MSLAALIKKKTILILTKGLKNEIKTNKQIQDTAPAQLFDLFPCLSLVDSYKNSIMTSVPFSNICK